MALNNIGSEANALMTVNTDLLQQIGKLTCNAIRKYVKAGIGCKKHPRFPKKGWLSCNDCILQLFAKANDEAIRKLVKVLPLKEEYRYQALDPKDSYPLKIAQPVTNQQTTNYALQVIVKNAAKKGVVLRDEESCIMGARCRIWGGSNYVCTRNEKRHIPSN